MKQGTSQPETIRTAGAADAELLATLINAAFAVECAAIEGERVNHAKLEAFLRTGEFLLLERNGELHGCVYLEKRGKRGYLGLLAVEPKHQGNGLGRRLAREAEERLRELGCRCVDLRVISARAELIAFYAKLGYRQSGTSSMPSDTRLKVPCHFIHLTKALPQRIG